MNKFFGWLIVFFLLLFTIPVFLMMGWIVPAKILGVITVLLLSFSVRLWLYRTKKEYDPKERIRMNLNDRFWMKKEFPFYNSMNSSDKKIFEDRVGVFLSKVPVCYSSGELLKDRTLALRTAAHLLITIADSDEFIRLLPTAIIIEDECWDDRMALLRTQDGVMVLSKDF
jgi:hypothetical protein